MQQQQPIYVASSTQMNKKVNKTTTRKEQLKLNAVMETAADHLSHQTGESISINTGNK